MKTETTAEHQTRVLIRVWTDGIKDSVKLKYLKLLLNLTLYPRPGDSAPYSPAGFCVLFNPSTLGCSSVSDRIHVSFP